jgi:Ni/Co efflux regulator RcnB
MKRLLLAASVALLLSSTNAFASPWHGDGGHGHGHGGQDRAWHGDNDDHGRWHGDRDDRNNRWRDNDYHDNGRHLGQYKHFRRGDRAPVVYLQPRYYVNDWRGYRLPPPPRGYRWVRPDDGRFLLVAITTGVIADMLGY